MYDSADIVRASIGIIYPDFADADWDYYDMAGRDVNVHVTRYGGMAPGFDDAGLDPVEGLKEHFTGGSVAEAAQRFSRIHPDVLAYGCLSCSLAGGPGYSTELCEILSKWGDCPATTGTTALLEALRALHVSRIAVVSFYEPRVFDMFERVLSDAGVQCVNQGAGAITEPDSVVEFFEALGFAWGRSQIRSPAVAYHVGKMVDCPQAEAVVVTSTGFRTGPMIERLEHDLGKPVVTANQALIWHALQLARVQPSVPGFGRLFRLRAV